MKRCVILAAALIADYTTLAFQSTSDDFIIAADGGLRHCEPLGLRPAVVIGDMDSLQGQAMPEGAEVFPVHKDDTDMMLAIKKGIALGYREFVLLGALGGRIDHTFANIQTLGYLLEQGCKGEIVGEGVRMFLLKDGTVTITENPRYLSVFAYSDRCEGVYESGVEYPLHDATLTTGFPLGISNKQIEKEAVISVRAGTLLIILESGE